MFHNRFQRLGGVVLLVLLAGLLAGCNSGEPTAVPTETPAEVPATTEFSSPLPEPTMTTVAAVPEPTIVVPRATVDLSRTPVAVVDAEIGPDGEVITIQNVSNEDRDIGDWILLNLDSDEVFRFPDALVLTPGETVKVYSGMAESEVPEDGFFWREEKMWNADPANILLLNDVTRLMYWRVEPQNP